MSERQRPSRTAGLFDIRNVIGALLGIYGVLLVAVGLFATSSADKERAAGVNANLWSGVVLLLVAIFFGVWAHLRPTVVKHTDSDGR